MSEYWLVFANHDLPSDRFLSLTVGPVPAEQLEEFLQRKVTIPFEDGEILLKHVETFDHEPDADELAPPGHKWTDG